MSDDEVYSSEEESEEEVSEEEEETPAPKKEEEPKAMRSPRLKRTSSPIGPRSPPRSWMNS